MRIAWSGRHTPYAYMFMRAFPELSFTVDAWDEIFRPLPENAKWEPWSGDYDVLITDHWDLTPLDVSAKRKVFIDHNEYSHSETGGQHVIDNVDAFVSVSEHKLWTHRELCFNPKVHWIWFCFDEAMFPERRYDLPKKVGFVHNGLNGEQAIIANGVLWGHDSVGIGHGNTLFMGKLSSPCGLDGMLDETGSLSAAINIVNGDSCGMSPLELMAQGVPVVFGASLDLPRFLFSGWNCFITRNRATDSLEEMREYVSRLVNDQDFNRRMGAMARKTVLQELSVDLFRRKWSAVLQLKLPTDNNTP